MIYLRNSKVVAATAASAACLSYQVPVMADTSSEEASMVETTKLWQIVDFECCPKSADFVEELVKFTMA